MNPSSLAGSPVRLLLLFLMAAPAAFAQHPELLVAQKGERALAIVDPADGNVIANVAENGVTGHEVAASPDGRIAVVPIYGNSGVGKPGTDGSNILFIDLATRKIVGNVQFPHGVRPHCPMFGRDGLVYVTTELDHAITIIDPKTYKIVGSIPTGQAESHMLILSHDGRRGYTANVGPGTVSVLDIKARKLVKIIPVVAPTQRIAISNDDRWVFTSDQSKPQLAVIDTHTLKVVKWVPLHGLGYGAAPSTDGRWLLVAVPEANDVDVVDLRTMQLARAVPLGAGTSPQEVLVRPDGKTAFVSCAGTNRVAEIDLANWKVTRMIVTGKGTDGLSWARGE
jgi:DNA-binding beta-propeller fold protein YncE